MKKLFLIAVFIQTFFLWGADNETVLFWTVDTTECGIEFYGAELFAVIGDGTAESIDLRVNKEGGLTTKLNWSNADQCGGGHSILCDDPGCIMTKLNASDSNYATTAASFYIELFNAEWETIGYFQRGEYISMNDLLTMNSVEGMISDWQTDIDVKHICPGWTATDFSTVPEPTGGVLSLLGVALLALRRRRVA